MKTSTEIDSIAKITGEEKAIEYIAKAGFDAWDFSMFYMFNYDDYDWTNHTNAKFSNHPTGGNDYLKFARKLKKIGEDNGIVCNQSHAPFPTMCREIRDGLKRAIECTAEAGGKICVIHPDNNGTAEKNAEMYLELLPFAKDYGVKIATENMYNWDTEKDCALEAACPFPQNFLDHINAVNDDFLVACLDIGHAEMFREKTSAVEMVRALGPHLQALHIHDNDLVHDSHQIPFSMNIEFEAIVKALKEIDYKGYFTLEADRYLFDYDNEKIFEGVKNLSGAARRLADMYDNL